MSTPKLDALEKYFQRRIDTAGKAANTSPNLTKEQRIETFNDIINCFVEEDPQLKQCFEEATIEGFQELIKNTPTPLTVSPYEGGIPDGFVSLASSPPTSIKPTPPTKCLM